LQNISHPVSFFVIVGSRSDGLENVMNANTKYESPDMEKTH